MIIIDRTIYKYGKEVLKMIHDCSVFYSAFRILHIDLQSYHVKAFEFLFSYREKIVYIANFFETLETSIVKIEDDINLKKIFEQLLILNGQEMDQLNFQESDYYFFLRLKVFIFDLQNEDDLGDDHGWLRFFQDKFIANI